MTIGTTKTFTVRCSAETEAKALARVEAEIERSGHGAKFKVTGRTATLAVNKLIRSVEVEHALSNTARDINDLWVCLTSYGMSPSKELGSIWEAALGS